MTRKTLGALALCIGSVIIFALPAGSFGKGDLRSAREALVQAGQQLQAGLESTVQKTGEKTAALVEKTKAGLKKATAQDAKTRATATDPPVQPPTHGTNPHGQGTVAVVDINPSAERPLAADPDGGDSGEDVVVGRARGERNADGTYHGHISAVGLFGNDVIPVDTAPGETKDGPLQSLQANILDPLCTNTNQQVCLTVLRMHSATTGTSSTNDFAVARASLLGLGVGAADSQGVAGQAGACQTSAAGANTANVATSTGTLAQVAKSTSISKSCKGVAPEVTQTSQVIGLGGTGVPLPAAGCANGTPDTQAGLPGLLPIICNAEELVGNNAAVREALDVFALQVGTNSLLKETTAASESLSVAPEGGTQCSDGIDNDGDGLIDDLDGGCHSDGNPANPNSYVPSDNDESNGTGTGSGTGTGGGDNGDDGDDGGDAQCADGRDNDGDGVIDEDDPGCHEGNNINNPYNPDDDSEGSDGSGGGGDAGSGDLGSDELPFTGTDVIGIALAGLLVLAGGLLLRRREEDVNTVS